MSIFGHKNVLNNSQGSLGVTPEPSPQRKPWTIVVGLIVSIILICLYFYAVKEYFSPSTLKEWMYAVYGLFVYLFFAFFVRPMPDMNNLGMVNSRGQTVDNPFTGSDNVNRGLLTLSLILLPGLIVTQSLWDAIKLPFRKTE